MHGNFTTNQTTGKVFTLIFIYILTSEVSPHSVRWPEFYTYILGGAVHRSINVLNIIYYTYLYLISAQSDISSYAMQLIIKHIIYRTCLHSPNAVHFLVIYNQ